MIAHFFAVLLYRLFGDVSRMPFPILDWVIDHSYGGWAGVSLFYEGRRHNFEIRKKKIKAGLLFTLAAATIALFIFLLWQNFFSSSGFLAGFFENFYSDLLVGILIAYWITQYLDRQKNRKLRLYGVLKDAPGNPVHKEIQLFLQNTGEETYYGGEIFWDLLFEDNLTNQQATVLGIKKTGINVNISTKSFVNYTGFVENPIFPTQTVEIFRLSADIDLETNVESAGKYFSLRTPYGKVPRLDTMQMLERIGAIDGTPFEMYQFFSFYDQILFDNYYHDERIIPYA